MKTFWKIVFGSTLGCILASVVGFLLFFSLIGAIAGMAGAGKNAPLPSGEKVLRLDFSKPVTEQGTEGFTMVGMNPAFGSSISLYSMVKAIEAAAEDPQVKFIYMNTDNCAEMSLASLEEIRTALARFRDSGKAVISYCNTLTNQSYYMASVADKVMFNGYGDAMMFGMSSGIIFFKDALDKLGIDMQLIRHGKYKAAGEQFTKNELTPENREQNQVLIDGIWNAIVSDIAASRDFTAEEFNSWLDNLDLTNASVLLEKGIVDELCYRTDLEDYLCGICDAKKIENINFVDVAEYAKAKVKQPLRAKDKIAVVYADGEIVVENSPYAQGGIAGAEYAAMLSEIRRDSTIKAVVLRVNSPGGSAQGAEMINHELGLLKAVKPVIASYGDYAASGGYWISARADRVFVDNTTITGSIGVFSMIPAFGNALKKKIGVNIAPVNSNRHSDALSMMRPLDDDEIKFMEANVEKVYSDFTSLVAEGRNMTVEQVDEIGQGRVWTGSDALKNGLADERGGLFDAIRYAESLVSDGKDFKIVEYPVTETTYEKLMKSLSGVSALSPVEAAYSKIREDSYVTLARLPWIYEFR
ncbi:MAG: signal peptide peptidase SppA [Bacteroidales bacterium]|nr:signal peptide peptidase SppA [Bacteroidales bacterium]